MDKKSIAILVAAFALSLVSVPVFNKLFPPPPKPAVVAAPAVTTNSASLSAATPAPALAGTNLVTTPGVAPELPAPVKPAFDTNVAEQLLVYTNGSARYTFTSHGGGIKTVELLAYPEAVSALRLKKVAAQGPVALNDDARLPIGSWADTSGGIYALTPIPGGVHAEQTTAEGVRITKDFVFGSNYLVALDVKLENTDSVPRAVAPRELAIGTTRPLNGRDNGQLIGIMWQGAEKVDETATAAWFMNHSFFGCITGHSAPRTEYRAGSNDVFWVGSHNQFFAFAAVPEQAVAEVVARSIVLPRFADTPANAADPEGYQCALGYPAILIAPGQTVHHKLSLYAGPKEYRTLARVADGFKNSVDLVMGYGGFFGGFARVLLLAMNWLHDVLRLPYGWAIIAITILLKTLFWPLTAASTRSMKRMQKFQPEMKAIQEKYKDDPAKMNKKTMEFMREHKINPAGGCLPMLITIPIFIGFYRMIQGAIELRGAPFLWIGDLAQPDTLYVITSMGWFPFIGIPGVGLPINLLPILMGATQIWQMSLTPPSPGMDPAQQKMMRYMPLMFIVILYNFSAGLALYWTAQNLLSILQTKLTKNEEEAVVITPKKA